MVELIVIACAVFVVCLLGRSATAQAAEISHSANSALRVAAANHAIQDATRSHGEAKVADQSNDEGSSPRSSTQGAGPASAGATTTGREVIGSPAAGRAHAPNQQITPQPGQIPPARGDGARIQPPDKAPADSTPVDSTPVDSAPPADAAPPDPAPAPVFHSKALWAQARPEPTQRATLGTVPRLAEQFVTALAATMAAAADAIDPLTSGPAGGARGLPTRPDTPSPGGWPPAGFCYGLALSSQSTRPLGGAVLFAVEKPLLALPRPPGQSPLTVLRLAPVSLIERPG